MNSKLYQTAAAEREEQTLAHMHKATIPAAATVAGFQCKRASLSLICLFDAAQRLQHSVSQFHFSAGEVTAEDDERRSEGSKFGFFFSFPPSCPRGIDMFLVHSFIAYPRENECLLQALRHALSSHTHTHRHQVMGSLQIHTHTHTPRAYCKCSRAVTHTRAFILVGFHLPLRSFFAARRPAVRLDGDWNSINE